MNLLYEKVPIVVFGFFFCFSVKAIKDPIGSRSHKSGQGFC